MRGLLRQYSSDYDSDDPDSSAAGSGRRSRRGSTTHRSDQPEMPMAAKLDWWQQVKWRKQMQQEKVDRENAAARLVQVGCSSWGHLCSLWGSPGRRVLSQQMGTLLIRPLNHTYMPGCTSRCVIAARQQSHAVESLNC